MTGLSIGYARVSTDDQNLTLQTDALIRAGVEEGRIYTDKASGADMNRPGFVAAFKALRPGDTLVVWKLDRLGRNLSQLIQTAERLQERGTQLKVITEAIDTSTPMGRFMFNVMGSFAQLEREMIQERTKAGLLAARERGRIGGRRPIDQTEQAARVRQAIKDKAEGGEGLSVAKAARREGVARSTIYKLLAKYQQTEGANDLTD